MPAELKKEKLYAVDEEEDDGIPKEAPLKWALWHGQLQEVLLQQQLKTNPLPTSGTSPTSTNFNKGQTLVQNTVKTRFYFNLYWGLMLHKQTKIMKESIKFFI